MSFFIFYLRKFKKSQSAYKDSTINYKFKSEKRSIVILIDRNQSLPRRSAGRRFCPGVLREIGHGQGTKKTLHMWSRVLLWNLSLWPLWSLSRFFESRLLPLLDSRISFEMSVRLQSQSIIWIPIYQSSCECKFDGISLTSYSTALQAYFSIEFLHCVVSNRFKRRNRSLIHIYISAKILLEGFFLPSFGFYKKISSSLGRQFDGCRWFFSSADCVTVLFVCHYLYRFTGLKLSYLVEVQTTNFNLFILWSLNLFLGSIPLTANFKALVGSFSKTSPSLAFLTFPLYPL